MKRFVWWVAVIGCVVLRGGGAVMSLPLSAGAVTEVPTHPSLAVLIEFPAPITDYAGRGFTEEAGVVAGDFLLRWGAHDSYLVVAPLVEGARATLHVRVGDQSYPIEFFPSAREQAWAKVVFRATPGDPGSGRRENVIAATVGRVAKAMPPAADPGRWLGVCELLRRMQRLQPAQVKALLAVEPGLSFDPGVASWKSGACEFRRVAMLRSEKMDTIAIVVAMRNAGLKPVRFRTDTLVVRCGERLYPAAITDWPSELAPGEEAEAVLAIAGDGLGGRNNLALQNEFRISLAEAGPATPSPRTAP